MPAAFTDIRLTDGVTTLTLTDAVSYGLNEKGWAPKVARARKSLLGGRGPYEDVEEVIAIDIQGASGVDQLANLNALADLLEQADRWARGEYVNPVIVKYVPQNSNIATTGTPYQAVVLGGWVELPEDFHDLLMVTELNHATVHIVRAGQWLLGELASGTAASINSGDVATCTLATGLGGSQPHSPLAITLGTWTTTNVATLYGGFVICTGNTPSEDGIKTFSGLFAGAGAGGYGTVNESANNAKSGANTTRYTPTGTAFSACNAGALSWTSARKLAIFATVRNNDATKSYQIRAGYSKDDTRNAAVRTGITVVDGSSTQPRAIFIGNLTLPNAQYGNLFIEIAASATGSTIDIDELVVVCLDDDTSCVIGHDGMNMSGVFGAGITVYFDIQHRMMGTGATTIRPEPFVGIHQNAAQDGIALTYRGDARLRTGRTEINVLWLTTTGAKWRFSQGGGSLQTFTVTPQQYQSYLTPV